MNTKQVQFLVQRGLIKPEILAGWTHVNVGGLTPNITRGLENQNAVRRIMKTVTFILVICITIIFTIFFVGDSDQKKTIPPLIMILGTTYGIALIIALRESQTKFIDEITALDNIFADNADGSGFVKTPYLLHEYSETFPDTILRKLGDDLGTKEESNGVDSPEANTARIKFKEAHRIFVSFGLCDKNQGKWLPRNQPRQSTQPKEASSAPITIAAT